MSIDGGLGRLLELVKEHFGHKPYMATLVLVWAALVAGALSLIGAFVVSPAVRIMQSIISWLREGTTPISISSVVQNGIILAIVIVLLAIMWNRIGRRLPQVDQDSERIINLEKDKPRWEHTEADLRNLESEFRRYSERLIAIERQISSMQTVLQPLNTQTRVKELLENVNRFESNLSGLQTQVRELRSDLGPRSNIDVDAIRRSISINYLPSDPGFIVDEVGMIQRRLVFRFEITHFSPNVRIEPTHIVKGSLVAYSSRHDALKWSVWCPDPKLLSVGDKLILHVDYPITERFAETLAFKANQGNRVIELSFSEMEVEFQAHDLDDRPGPVVGFRSLGGTVRIPVDDHVAFKSIRDAYNRLHPQ